ncbi:energy transducer TonB [Sphingobium sp. LMA1-1-1.1]|uniref:energy transducer TonB n=1 Tax=Sphingobium sp. LMA1-1-1.1 TaxID=3135238 RepID=UPI003434742B
MKLPRLAVPLLSLVIVAAAPVPSAAAHRATPLVSPGTWLTDADYPRDAARAQIDGTTAFRLELDKAGVPQRCTITSSSGSALLDNATCDKLMIRARFTPAKDARGRAIADVYNGRITWRLPDPNAPAQMMSIPHMIKVTFYVNPDGTTSDCTATLNDVDPGPPEMCANMVLNRHFPVQNDAAGKPIRQKLRMIMGIEKVANQP